MQTVNPLWNELYVLSPQKRCCITVHFKEERIIASSEAQMRWIAAAIHQSNIISFITAKVLYRSIFKRSVFHYLSKSITYRVSRTGRDWLVCLLCINILQVGSGISERCCTDAGAVSAKVASCSFISQRMKEWSVEEPVDVFHLLSSVRPL